MRRAFTLIELLVVIAIIAILAAILFPVFAQAKASAKRTTGLSNVKQLALAMILYQNDNDDILPGAMETGATVGGDLFRRSYDWTIQPYVKNWDILRVPGDTEGNEFPGDANPSGRPMRRAFGMPSNVGSFTRVRDTSLNIDRFFGRNASTLPEPSQTVLLTESGQYGTTRQGATTGSYPGYAIGAAIDHSTRFRVPYVVSRFQNVILTAYVDGHARAHRYSVVSRTSLGTWQFCNDGSCGPTLQLTCEGVDFPGYLKLSSNFARTQIWGGFYGTDCPGVAMFANAGTVANGFQPLWTAPVPGEELPQ
ncbi:MAG: prepilin-type N-terminal cleavage/methylation domain-containing protein [Fimbriimonadaceae bacterium]